MGRRRTIISITLILLAGSSRALADSGEFTIHEVTSAGEPIFSFKRALKLLDGQLLSAATQTSAEPFIDFTKHTDFAATLPDAPDTSPVKRKFALDVTGQVEIPSAGTWSIGIVTHGGAKLSIDGKTVRSVGGTRVKPITFSQAGIYTADVTYFGNTKTDRLEILDSPGKFHSLRARRSNFQPIGAFVQGGLALAGTSPSAGSSAPLLVGAGETISAGASSTQTGLLTPAGLTWDGGATYSWKINDAAGTAGNTDGWDEITTNSLAVDSASASQPVTIALSSLNGTSSGTPAGVQAGGTYSWVIASTSTPLTVNGVSQSPENLLNTQMFALDTSGFTVDGSPVSSSDFSLDLVSVGNGDNLQLSFQATPEPGTAVLIGVCVAPSLLRRRRRGQLLRRVRSAAPKCAG